MPNVLALKRKSDGSIVTGRNLIALDGEICQAVGVKPHPRDFYLNWMFVLGFQLASGTSTHSLLDKYNDGTQPQLLGVAAYLAANFDNISYYER